MRTNPSNIMPSCSLSVLLVDIILLITADSLHTRTFPRHVNTHCWESPSLTVTPWKLATLRMRADSSPGFDHGFHSMVGPPPHPTTSNGNIIKKRHESTKNKHVTSVVKFLITSLNLLSRVLFIFISSYLTIIWYLFVILYLLSYLLYLLYLISFIPFLHKTSNYFRQICYAIHDNTKSHHWKL